MKIDLSPEFLRNLKKLKKRYPHVRDDVTAFRQLFDSGKLPGDKVQGVGYEVYKARLRNSDARRGKSGGYRVIYYLRQADAILLVTIYSKSDQSDIPSHVIRDIILEYERSQK